MGKLTWMKRTRKRNGGSKRKDASSKPKSADESVEETKATTMKIVTKRMKMKTPALRWTKICTPVLRQRELNKIVGQAQVPSSCSIRKEALLRTELQLQVALLVSIRGRKMV